MKKNAFLRVSKSFSLIILLFVCNILIAQQQSNTSTMKSDFWNHVQFGGGLGLGFGSNYTDISIAPSAIYNFNNQLALGLGTQYTYIKQKGFYASHLYGGSVIALFNPINEIQLSVELEELRVNINGDRFNTDSQNFWNTGLFLGAGYRTGNVTIGARYNILQDNSKNVYGDAFMPFVRVYF